MARRRVNPMKFALMGAVAGIAKNLTEQWATERARAAKMLEMQELRAMSREDAAVERDFQLSRDKTQSEIRKGERSEERAWLQGESEKERNARLEEQRMQEAGANARNAASVAAQREGNAARGGGGGESEGGVIIKTPSGMQRFIGMTQYNQLAPEVQSQMEIIGTFDNKRNPRMLNDKEDSGSGPPSSRVKTAPVEALVDPIRKQMEERAAKKKAAESAVPATVSPDRYATLPTGAAPYMATYGK